MFPGFTDLLAATAEPDPVRGEGPRVGAFAPLIAAGLFALGYLVAPGRALCASPAFDPGTGTVEIPSWFAPSFLDFRDDIADAARDGKRLLVYFGQEGCPYCRQLMINNFSQRSIVEKTRRHFVAIALDIWGDREVTWRDGRTMSEKELARELQVQFTPTLLFFDERGDVVARLNGYYPPQRFEAVLDYVAGHLEGVRPLTDHLNDAARTAANPQMRDEPFFMRPPHDLRRRPGAKPLAVVFETGDCAPCDELHGQAFRRIEVLHVLDRFDTAQLALGGDAEVTTPDGRRTTAAAWARELRVTYAPTIVLFDASGAEVFRIEAYLRPFHLASALDYVASGRYRAEPSFQRYLQARAASMRARGEQVDLWR
jgi:thioredoxin-related protein